MGKHKNATLTEAQTSLLFFIQRECIEAQAFLGKLGATEVLGLCALHAYNTDQYHRRSLKVLVERNLVTKHDDPAYPSLDPSKTRLGYYYLTPAGNEAVTHNGPLYGFLDSQ